MYYLGVREGKVNQEVITRFLRHQEDKLKFRSYVTTSFPVEAAARVFKEGRLAAFDWERLQRGLLLRL